MNDLCTACLCGDRNLYFIGETGFYPIYSQILNEINIYDLSQVCIRVCWECRALLRRIEAFKHQVKRSYTQLLQYIHQSDIISSIANTPHLKSQQVINLSIPQHEVKIELEGEDCVKNEVEIEHCEPETFVNDLNLEPARKRKVVKKEKAIKQKSKRKLKKEKSPIKYRAKVKKKRSVSNSPIHIDEGDDYKDDDVDPAEEDDMSREEIVEDRRKETKQKKTNKLNGTAEPPRPAVTREALPEKPQCAECGKKFSSRKTYSYHINVLHKGQNRYPCPRCGKVYQWKSNLGRHMRSHKDRDTGSLHCALCDKRFASVATYRQHLRVSRRHVPETDFNFMCNECGKKFVNKIRLRDHIDWEHLKKIKFRCQLCNKPFKCHTSLYVHLQNVHKNKEKKNNLCHVCGKSYQNAAKLKYHIVAMHTSETPYQCEQCNAAFGWYSSLYRHVREVHYKMKVQPKKSKKSKKAEVLPSLLPAQMLLPHLHQPGPA